MTSLEAKGLRFHHFTLVNEGDYTAQDAEWNYMDLLHFEHVHKQSAAINAAIEGSTLMSVFLQNVMGLHIPMAVSVYRSSARSSTYFTAALGFVLVVETCYDDIGPVRARVETTYSIGSHPLLLRAAPLIERLLRRNYEVLMADDIPMRLRRGQLRNWGYSFFRKGASSTPEESMELGVPKVVPPVGVAPPAPLELDVRGEMRDGECRLLGRSDHYGLRVLRSGPRLLVHRRLCSHEGAELDQSPCEGARIRCPWHGRVFKPAADFDLDATQPQHAEESPWTMRFEDGRLRVEFQQLDTLGAPSR